MGGIFCWGGSELVFVGLGCWFRRRVFSILKIRRGLKRRIFGVLVGLVRVCERVRRDFREDVVACRVISSFFFFRAFCSY